ncbi:MAG: peptidoglycan DD-metalloendopeptidase family protein [Longimicrobiales bacterium]
MPVTGGHSESSSPEEEGAGDRPRQRPAVSSLTAAAALVLSVTTLVFVVLLGDWGRPLESLREFFRDPTPHEEYLMGLSASGLASSALGRDWIAAARVALEEPLVIEPPYLEEGFFPQEEASALGYRFSLPRGRRLKVTVELENGQAQDAKLFLDLFRVAPDTLRPPVHLLSPEPGAPLVFEPRRTGDYLIRVQPELLRSGRFRVTIESDATLEFPVAGHTSRAIGSFFGDPREGGRRAHHGVDIFAPRGTPVVAVSEAYVRQVDTTLVGGRVIWLRDRRTGASVYYAHLHRILTRAGVQVSAGDTIGTVGNTGNARSTPPHLHFGLYSRGEGPIDPWDYLYQPPRESVPVEVQLAGLGKWARVGDQAIQLRDRPARRARVLTELPRHTAVRVMGGVGPWYRVRLPDGGSGFVAGRLTEEMGEPLWLERVVEAQSIQATPLPGSPVMDELQDGTEIPVMGTFGGFLYVRSPTGRPGWMASTDDREAVAPRPLSAIASDPPQDPPQDGG